MTDRELLERLFRLLVNRDYVAGDPDSIMDMVNRYQRPPLTMHYRIAMQMTVNDYKRLADVLETISKHLYPKPEGDHATDVSGNRAGGSPGDLPLDAPAQQ